MDREIERTVRLFLALAGAAVMAYALGYVMHARYGISLLTIRRDAFISAGFLALAMMLKSLLESGGS